MAQKVEAKTERPLQTFWLKNFAAVNTVASRISLPQDACFYDLTNAQPIGFSNLHSISDAGPMIHDFGDDRVYADYNVNIGGAEYLLIGTRRTTMAGGAVTGVDGSLWSYQATPGTTSGTSIATAPLPRQVVGQVAQIGDGLSGGDTLDVAQYDNNTALIIDARGYYRWVPTFNPESPQSVTQIEPVDTSHGAPSSGSCIAVYNNMVWIADGRTLYYSAAGTSDETPPGYANFTQASGAGQETINDSTLRSDIKALFAANGYLYVFGETSIDAISDVSVTTTYDTLNIPHTVTNYTRLNISSVVGTEHVESIVAFGRLIFFANQMGVWMIYGTTVVQQSTDANNSYYSGIDGTWQYLDWNHSNDAVQWINRQSAIVDWQNSWGAPVLWQLDNYMPYPFHISAGQVKSNNLFCAAFLVVRKNDPIMGSGNFLVMYQGDASGSNYKWWFADWTKDIGPITHICTAMVNFAPALFGYVNNKMYQFFANPASAPSARMMTGLWDFGDPLSDKQALRAGIRVSLRATANPAMHVRLDTITNSYPIRIGDIGVIDWVNSTEQIAPWQNNVPSLTQWQNLRNFMIYWGRAPEAYSTNLGFTVNTERGTLFELNAFLLDYKSAARWMAS